VNADVAPVVVDRKHVFERRNDPARVTRAHGIKHAHRDNLALRCNAADPSHERRTDVGNAMRPFVAYAGRTDRCNAAIPFSSNDARDVCTVAELVDEIISRDIQRRRAEIISVRETVGK